MIEFLNDAIRATAGSNIVIPSRITEDDAMIEGVELVLHLDDVEVVVEPYVEGEVMIFEIPAEVTAGRHGRFWYCFRRDEEMLCFKQPFYLV